MDGWGVVIMPAGACEDIRDVDEAARFVEELFTLLGHRLSLLREVG